MVKSIKPTPSLQKHSKSDLDKICSLDYRLCRQYLAKNIYPTYPRFLYKFMGLPKDSTKREVYLKDILLKSKLWLSSPTDFNDPFDMTARVEFEGSTNQLKEKFRNLIAVQSDLKWKDRQFLLNKFMSRPRGEWKESLENAFKKCVTQSGVFSFAGDPRSILMWSHYADNHQGVCLQFEVARHPRLMLEALPVNYIDDYPTFNWANDSGSQLRKVILGKFKNWDYEKESRIVLIGKSRTFVEFRPQVLTRVILGCRADDRVKAILNNILNERKELGLPDIKIYMAYKHSRKYELLIRKLD